LGRVIQEHIKKPLAEELLFGQLKKGGTVRVAVETAEDGEDKLKLEIVPDSRPVRPKAPPARKAKPKRARPKAEPVGEFTGRSERPRRSSVPQLPRRGGGGN